MFIINKKNTCKIMKVNFQSHVDGVTFTEKHVCSGIKMKGDED